jgi:hypothetical protein
MYVLHIEHRVPSFDNWKRAFDSDPAGRQKAGVRRYRILRDVEDANLVTIDLEFDTVRQAQALLASLRVIWGRIEGTVIIGPQARISESVETKEF